MLFDNPPEERKLPPKFRGIKRREFFEVIVAEGKGTDEDCIREVHYFMDEEGKIKFIEDPNERTD
jgi:hypothetical protein